MSITKYEDKEICKQCGGKCCIKSGCDYFVSDFSSMKMEELDKILNTERVSIVASFNFKRLKNQKLVYEVILSIRERNQNRDIIDLLSFKTRCASLTKNGCSYDLEKRPSGGSSLIPNKDGLCYSKVDRLKELKKWEPYQKILSKLVKKYTNKTVEEKLKEDVETLIYNVLTENYQDSLQVELQDIARMIPLLQECFPQNCEKAIQKYQKEKTNQLVKKSQKKLKHQNNYKRSNYERNK